MKLTQLMMAATVTVAALGAGTGAAWAQAKEQFFPLLSYRTGPYAPNGVPWANGKQDYIKMVNARDGGIPGAYMGFPVCMGFAYGTAVDCSTS